MKKQARNKFFILFALFKYIYYAIESNSRGAVNQCGHAYGHCAATSKEILYVIFRWIHLHKSATDSYSNINSVSIKKIYVTTCNEKFFEEERREEEKKKGSPREQERATEQETATFTSRELLTFYFKILQ